LTEQELISGLQKGEEQAFKELVLKFQHKVYNTSIGLLQHSTDAEDVAQEVFIEVYRSIKKFRQDSSLATWIYRITVTKSLDKIRSRRRKKRFGYVISQFGDDNKPLYEPVHFDHPGVEMDKKEDAAILFRMINKLPENQKTAFILNKLEGLSYAEIAVIMKTSDSAVDALLQRAKQNLRKSLNNIN
jgi:RNA polymerase sigma-70 factor (ECF subfamily)